MSLNLHIVINGREVDLIQTPTQVTMECLKGIDGDNDITKEQFMTVVQKYIGFLQTRNSYQTKCQAKDLMISALAAKTFDAYIV